MSVPPGAHDSRSTSQRAVKTKHKEGLGRRHCSGLIGGRLC
jgi:hypothetical protein